MLPCIGCFKHIFIFIILLEFFSPKAKRRIKSVEFFDSKNPDKGWKKSDQFSLPVIYFVIKREVSFGTHYGEQEMVDTINRTLMFTVYFDVYQLIDNLENVVRLGLYKKNSPNKSQVS